MPEPDYLSLWEYFSEAFVPEQRLNLPLKPAHKRICDMLEDAYRGFLPPQIRFVILNMPPRIGKTKIVEALGSWGEGEFPGSQFIYTGYSGDLAERSLSYIGDVMQAPWYIEMYGDRLHGRRSDRLSTLNGGQFFAEGVGGTLTGKGAGLKEPGGGVIVIDDPAKPDEALSPVMAENVRFWFENTLLSRRNSDVNCPIIIICQRLAPGDLAGYVEKTYPESTLKVVIPALVDADGNEANTADDAAAAGAHSQFPETVSTETLLSLRKTRTGRFVLAAQYQQRPVAFGGNLIQPDLFHRFDPTQTIKFERFVITVDTAMKIKQANDFSALELWGLANRRAYLVDLMHGKWESPELLQNTITFWNKWKELPELPRPRLKIEEKAAGTGLIQQLRAAGIPATGIERSIDKVQRVQSILPFIEAGFIYVPKDGSVPWIDKFLDECSSFAADGTAAHDDMVDAMVDGIEDLLGKALSIFEVLKDANPASEPESRFSHEAKKRTGPAPMRA